MDKQAANQSLALDQAWARAARRSWLALMDLVVWGEFRTASPGTLPKVRKRALDAGERLRSMFASRDWIPRERERLKNALASLLNLRQSLDELERAMVHIEAGADLAVLRGRCSELREIAERLGPAAARWAALLDSQHADDADDAEGD